MFICALYLLAEAVYYRFCSDESKRIKLRSTKLKAESHSTRFVEIPVRVYELLDEYVEKEGYHPGGKWCHRCKKKSFTKKLKKAVGWHWSNAKRQVTAEKMIVFSFQLFVELETDKSPS